MMQALGEEHLVGRLPCPTGLGYIGERPAAEEYTELPRIIDEDDGNSLASYVSSDDENVLRGPIGVVYNDVDVPDLSFWSEVCDIWACVHGAEDSDTDSCFSEGTLYLYSEGEAWFDLEESDVEDSDTDSCTSEESVYSSSEGKVCWSDLEESDAEDSDCSASGPGTSRKRSREESEESQPDAKRPRKSCEESFGEEQFSPKPPPSTSGLSFPQSLGWDVKRARWDDSSDSD
ncbi:uncharacterized protein PAE49_015847 [Odontesthes bonariensis]